MSEAELDLSTIVFDDSGPTSSGWIIDEEISEEMERELTLPDLRLYEQKGPSETAPRLAKVSFRHHRMAQLIALGYPQTKVAAMMGCTIPTVTRLCQDHAFRMLVESELEKLQDRDHSIQVKLAEVAEVGLDTLHDMLVAADGLKPAVVKDITMDVLDRAGHGPTRQVAVTKSFGIEAQTLERMKENARPARRLIPAVEQTSTSETPDPQAPVGVSGGESVREADSTEGEAGARTCLPEQILQIVDEEGE